ncbi:hypothetical protein BDZ91DRAFT_793571 [Kalaharituber pfeilii]|nr:hypothetical protein BDZ91DRAFT_793571 [Kalaharituber pfeilii]
MAPPRKISFNETPSRASDRLKKDIATISPGVKVKIEPGLADGGDDSYEGTACMPWNKTNLQEWLPSQLLDLIQLSTTREEWMQKVRWLVGIITIKVRALGDDLIRSLLPLLAPKTPGVVEVANEFQYIKDLTLEIQGILAGCFETLGRCYLGSPAGIEYLRNTAKKTTKSKKRREDPDTDAVSSFFQFTHGEVLMLWSVASRYFDISVKNPRAGVGREFVQAITNSTITIVSRYIRLMTPNGIVQPSLSVSARMKEFHRTNWPELAGWPPLVKPWEGPRTPEEWAAEPTIYDDPRDTPAWGDLLKRLGFEQKKKEYPEVKASDEAGPDIPGGGGRYNSQRSGTMPLEECNAKGEDDVVVTSSVHLDTKVPEPMSEDELEDEMNDISEGSAANWEKVLPNARLRSISAPMEIGSEFHDGSNPGLVNKTAMEELMDQEQLDGDFDNQTIQLVKNKLIKEDLIDYVTDEAIKIASLGPFGRARYVLEELKACSYRSDLIGMRERAKKEEAEGLMHEIIEAQRSAKRDMDLYLELKNEKRGSLKSVSTVRKEAIAMKSGSSAGIGPLKRSSTMYREAAADLMYPRNKRHQFNTQEEGVSSFRAEASPSSSASAMGKRKEYVVENDSFLMPEAD